MAVPPEVQREFEERLERYSRSLEDAVEEFLADEGQVQKQSMRSLVIAPGAELPKPKFDKPSEREASKPESWFDHDEALPVIEGRGKAGTARVQKADSLLRDAMIVERIREVAVRASADEAKKLFNKALKLASKIKSEVALQEARAYIKMLGNLARAAGGGKLKKAQRTRVYLQPGEEPPAGVEAKEGPRGGRYYLTEDANRVGRERGEQYAKERAARTKEGITATNLSEKAATAFRACAKLAKEIGWSFDIYDVTGHGAAAWASMWGAAGTTVGGKMITRALPYASCGYGEIHLGPDAVRDLEKVLAGETEWYATYVVPAIAHEINHAVNPLAGWGRGGTNSLIEEALTEWMQPDLSKRLLTEVFHLDEEIASRRAVVGAYYDEVENIEWAAATVTGKEELRWELHAKIKEWKEQLDPNHRDTAIQAEVIRALIIADFPDAPDTIIEEVGYSNQAFVNWSDMWQASSKVQKDKARRNLSVDAHNMAKRRMQDKGLMDVEKRPSAPSSPEARKQAARERVKRWRERLHERGDEEIRVAKRPEGWVWAIRNKKGLGLQDKSPAEMARLRESLPDIREVVHINGLSYPLLARKTPRGLSWFISDRQGRRISATVYGGDGAAAYLEILKREEQHAEGLRKDLAGPPADAMTGGDVGPIVPCGRCRRKVEKEWADEVRAVRHATASVMKGADASTLEYHLDRLAAMAAARKKEA